MLKTGRTSQGRDNDALDELLLSLPLAEAFDELPGLAEVDAGEGVDLDVNLPVGRQLRRREAEKAIDEPGGRQRAWVLRKRPDNFGYEVGRQGGLR